MNVTEAYLCAGCKVALSGPWFRVEPLFQFAEEPQECPWCQRERAYMKYLIVKRRK